MRSDACMKSTTIWLRYSFSANIFTRKLLPVLSAPFTKAAVDPESDSFHLFKASYAFLLRIGELIPDPLTASTWDDL